MYRNSGRVACIKLDSVRLTEREHVLGDPVGVGDVEELYRLLSRRLLRIVRGGVHAPDDVIEDACQFAWSRLVRHRGRVQRETVLSWLAATAVHEALKLVRRAGRELSLEALTEHAGELSPPSFNRAPHSMAEDRERLGSLAWLPPGQRRLLWLFGIGLSYEEIAQRQGCTGRVVERQLHQARASLRLRETQVATDRGR